MITEKQKIAKRQRQKEWREKYPEKHKEQYYEATRKTARWKQKFIWSVKSQFCADCKNIFPPWVMTFDHCLGKNFSLTNYSRSLDTLIHEMSLCEIVCCNCHANRTYQRKLP
jgi:molybdenum cofactor biosynthesis enzyme MoaA